MTKSSIARILNKCGFQKHTPAHRTGYMLEEVKKGVILTYILPSVTATASDEVRRAHDNKVHDQVAIMRIVLISRGFTFAVPTATQPNAAPIITGRK